MKRHSSLKIVVQSFSVGCRRRVFFLKKNLNQVITNAEIGARQELKKSHDLLAKSKGEVMHITTKKFEFSR